jgi:hypothetical protein
MSQTVSIKKQHLKAGASYVKKVYCINRLVICQQHQGFEDFRESSGPCFFAFFGTACFPWHSDHPFVPDNHGFFLHTIGSVSGRQVRNSSLEK